MENTTLNKNPRYWLYTRSTGAPSAILVDYRFWTTNQTALTLWCKKYGAIHRRMMVEFPDERTQTLWCLTWTP